VEFRPCFRLRFPRTLWGDNGGSSGKNGDLFRSQYTEGICPGVPDQLQVNRNTNTYFILLLRRLLLNTLRIGYTVYMFTISFCAAGCGRPAFTGSTLCATHSADPEAEAKKLGEYMLEQKVVKDICAQGLHFEKMDFSHHQFHGCNFSGASFYRCLFKGVIMRMNFMDFSTFSSCDFCSSDMQYLSLAGAVIKDCTFEGSELIGINFVGALIFDSTFNNTNLYNSRFVSANIARSDFIDCNLKRTNFVKSIREEISYKSSNTAEAIFEMEEYN